VKFGRPKVGKVVRYLPDKNNNISARSPALASAQIAPKICQSQLRTIYSEYPKFHPNPFTSGGVIAECVNVVETRHKVFPILGEATASSPSKHHYCTWHVQVVLNIKWKKQNSDCSVIIMVGLARLGSNHLCPCNINMLHLTFVCITVQANKLNVNIDSYSMYFDSLARQQQEHHHCVVRHLMPINSLLFTAVKCSLM